MSPGAETAAFLSVQSIEQIFFFKKCLSEEVAVCVKSHFQGVASQVCADIWSGVSSQCGLTDPLPESYEHLFFFFLKCFSSVGVRLKLQQGLCVLGAVWFLLPQWTLPSGLVRCLQRWRGHGDAAGVSC